MDIIELIVSDHHEQRRMFGVLDEVGQDPARLGPVWNRLSVLLEVHADAEERLFYPRLLGVGEGADGADTRIANSDHMAEEEREALADFRRRASLQVRHDLGVEFAVYEAAHAGGVPLTDEDPHRYVQDNESRR